MKKTLLTLLMTSFSTPILAEVEFLHWWTSKGEIKALAALEQQLQQHNIPLRHSPILGGGGDSAMTVLQARALAGNTPDVAQIEGPSIKAWDDVGIVHTINETAQKHQWDDNLYPLIININKSANGYVALPITLHRLNWMWVNHTVLAQLELQIPKTWPEMFQAMEKAQQANRLPLAIGEQSWQIALLFESLVIASGGVDFYHKALVELKRDHIDSEQMRLALRQLRKLASFVKPQQPNQNWDTATQLLVSDQALFQLGGDWILGDLIASDVKVPQQIGCYPTPQSHHAFLYNMDSFIFMDAPDFTQQQAVEVANVLADKQFQAKFNQMKGSIPVRTDIDLSGFNPCQIQSYNDFQQAMKNGLAIPSMGDSMAVNPVAQQAINSEIFNYYRNADVTEEAVLRRIIAIAQST
ncbi:putative binding protein component of ABC sugar transporter [Vibrio ichthyoenteri ATCC 700023]|uniref:Probable sugar-binding periplasmic protein n=1 Tax=Vibrio ichthyoenteri ATCC 700023 TaxID=870968 RepID=F9RYT8_9VIBR|nr:ABC transporter substrate-binding protein [Vibrio ichthyoenteri]EGU46298.1 putative binding protein component of ABC sugar transporter [Vibrio ichthyoenteri ATCC 700023]